MAIHSNTKAPKEINLMMVPLLQAAINGHIMQLIIKRRLKIFHILLLPSIFPAFSYPCTKPPTAPAIVPTPISQGAGGCFCCHRRRNLRQCNACSEASSKARNATHSSLTKSIAVSYTHLTLPTNSRV